MFNKYKYSLNRGLNIKSETKKKNINIKTYAVISQKSPALYNISVNS
jgi:23S rRNA maturation mini-RNase III